MNKITANIRCKCMVDDNLFGVRIQSRRVYLRKNGTAYVTVMGRKIPARRIERREVGADGVEWEFDLNYRRVSFQRGSDLLNNVLARKNVVTDSSVGNTENVL